MAHTNDNFNSKDDTSCGVIYFRDARELIIATGPPLDAAKDKEYVEKVRKFTGTKIVCGATTAEIFSREMNAEIKDNFTDMDPELPPSSSMQGVDLVTEGVLTLNKVESILNKMTPLSKEHGNGPADKIVSMLMAADKIHFLVGTRINQNHHQADMPVEIEIRRTLVNRIARLLEKKFIKDADVEYL